MFATAEGPLLPEFRYLRNANRTKSRGTPSAEAEWENNQALPPFLPPLQLLLMIHFAAQRRSRALPFAMNSSAAASAVPSRFPARPARGKLVKFTDVRR